MNKSSANGKLKDLKIPRIASKRRKLENTVEQELRETVNMRKHPELRFVNYKGWMNRDQNVKPSYLDSIYAKTLAKAYKTTHVKAFQSQVQLKSLAKTMEKSMSSGKINRSRIIKKRSTLRKSIIFEPPVLKYRISKGHLADLIKAKSHEELFQASFLLDSLRSKLLKVPY